MDTRASNSRHAKTYNLNTVDELTQTIVWCGRKQIPEAHHAEDLDLTDQAADYTSGIQYVQENQLERGAVKRWQRRNTTNIEHT